MTSHMTFSKFDATKFGGLYVYLKVVGYDSEPAFSFFRKGLLRILGWESIRGAVCSGVYVDDDYDDGDEGNRVLCVRRIK